MDYTSKRIAIAVDNDLYIIDTATGKDLIKPAFVGEKIDVMITESGTFGEQNQGRYGNESE